MQYLLIIYGDEGLRDQAIMQDITAAHMRLGAELQESGAMWGQACQHLPGLRQLVDTVREIAKLPVILG